MHLAPAHNRLPRAGVDPITDAATALVTVAAAIQRPLRHETIVVFLDDARRGLAIAVVSGTERPDDVLEVVECLTQPAATRESVAAIVVASIRPGAGALPSDLDRWLEMSELAEQAGVEVVEWFVIADGIDCPRDLLGEPPRW